MKRAPSRPVGKPSSSRTRLHGRPKSIQACTSCRKSKTRCEILQNIKPGVPVQCHRCEVLRAACSYSEMDRSLFKSKETPPEPAPSSKPDERQRPRMTFQSPMLKLIQDAASNLRNPDPTGPIPPFWSYLKNYDVDWTAPMTGIYEVTRQVYQPPYQAHPSIESITSLHQIITPSQIAHLLEIFTQKYVPWLNFNLMRATEGGILDLTCCTIAARHLDPHSRAIITPQLQQLTEDIIVRMVLNLKESQSLEAIQALLIVSLWTPICGYESKMKDVQALLSAAVGMAMNMRLHDASEKAIAMRESFQKEDGSFASKEEINDGMNRARLWVALTNIESLVCLGTTRTPLSRRTSSDIRLILLTPRPPTTEQECRDIRLRLGSELYDLVEAQDTTDVTNFEGVELWYIARKEALEEINRVQRLLLPLPVVADHDRAYFKFMLVVLRISRLLVLYRTLEQARMAPINPALFPLGFLQVKVHDQPVLVPIARELVQLSEAILVLLLEVDVPTLSTAPNTLFFMINFVAALAVAVKFMMIRHFGFELPGSSDAIMEKLPSILAQAALSEDHYATHSAVFLDMINGIWGRRHIEASDSTSEGRFNSQSPPTDASSPDSANSFASAAQPQSNLSASTSTSLPSLTPSPIPQTTSNSYPAFDSSQYGSQPHLITRQDTDLSNPPPDMSMQAEFNGLAYQRPPQDFTSFQDYQMGGGGVYTDGMFWGPSVVPPSQDQDPEFWTQFFSGVLDPLAGLNAQPTTDTFPHAQ